MNIGYDKIGAPLYCDTGLHDGDMRIDLHIRLYLSPQEYADYQGPESLQITLATPEPPLLASQPGAAGGRSPARRHGITGRLSTTGQENGA